MGFVEKMFDMLSQDRMLGDGPQSLKASTLKVEMNRWQEIFSSYDRKFSVDEAKRLDVARSVRVLITISEVEGDHMLDFCWKVLHGVSRGMIAKGLPALAFCRSQELVEKARLKRRK